MRFGATLVRDGRGATGIEVPADVVEALGAGRRPSVTVAVNGHTYRTTVGSRDGRFLLPVSRENRAAAGIEHGDEVEVELALDTEARVVEVPNDLRAALDADPAKRQAWERLPYSHQREHVLAIDAAKAAATRERRIAKTLEMLG